MSDIIISLEGSPCAGKSTIKDIIKTFLSNTNLSVSYYPLPEDVKKYRSEMPAYPETYEQARSNEKWFLEQDIIKLQGALANETDITLVERDYLSTLAFSYAHSKFIGIDTFPELMQEFEALKETDIPDIDLRLVSYIDTEEVISRDRKRTKKLDALFTNKNFLTPLTNYFLSSEHEKNTALIYTQKDIVTTRFEVQKELERILK